jgi:hypothetical protein
VLWPAGPARPGAGPHRRRRRVLAGRRRPDLAGCGPGRLHRHVQHLRPSGPPDAGPAPPSLWTCSTSSSSPSRSATCAAGVVRARYGQRGRCVGAGFGAGADMIGGNPSLWIESPSSARTAARPVRLADALADAKWDTSTTVAAPNSNDAEEKQPCNGTASDRDRRPLCLEPSTGYLRRAGYEMRWPSLRTER